MLNNLMHFEFLYKKLSSFKTFCVYVFKILLYFLTKKELDFKKLVGLGFSKYNVTSQTLHRPSDLNFEFCKKMIIK